MSQNTIELIINIETIVFCIIVTGGVISLAFAGRDPKDSKNKKAS